MLPVGTILLIIAAILVYFGVLHRVLDRMKLSDRGALVIIILMVVGTLIPNITVLRSPIAVSVNIGGAIVPLAVAVWLIATADEVSEKARSIFSAIVTGVVTWGLSKTLNPDEQFMRWSPILIFGIAAGIIAALAGRSRRSAFVGGIGGIVIKDIIHWIELALRKIPGAVAFGGAGTFDATVIAAILAVGLVELLGEAREKAVKVGGGNENDERKQ